MPLEAVEAAEATEVAEVRLRILIVSHSEQLLLRKVLSISPLNVCFR